MTKGTQMPGAPTPRAGRAWPPPPRGSKSWARGTTSPAPAAPPSGEFEAELARDLAALIECGLVVPIYDRGTIRYALADDVEGAPT
jgi:hypothetical protein